MNLFLKIHLSKKIYALMRQKFEHHVLFLSVTKLFFKKPKKCFKKTYKGANFLKISFHKKF